MAGKQEPDNFQHADRVASFAREMVVSGCASAATVTEFVYYSAEKHLCEALRNIAPLDEGDRWRVAVYALELDERRKKELATSKAGLLAAGSGI